VSLIGLYQSTATLVNQTYTVAGTYNTPSFSAANWQGGVLALTIGTVTGTSPTLAVQPQVSTDGGVTWGNAPTTTNTLGATIANGGVFIASATPSANSGPILTPVGSVYGGNLYRIAVTAGGTGSLSIPLKVVVDMQKRFADNA
jgi:hypothetical protein